MDTCGDCGGDLLMTSGTRDEFMAECEICHTLWAWRDFDDTPRKVADRLQHWVALLAIPVLLWILAGCAMGGQW